MAVLEALTQQPNLCKATSKLENGWVWLVCGLKIFIWNFQETKLYKVGQCFGLKLPESDLCHSVHLVTVVESDWGLTSCIPTTELSCVVATNSGTLVHVSLDTRKYRIMKPAQGWMWGLRGFLAFFFRKQSSSGDSVHQLLAGETLNQQQQSLYVLTTSCLQKWAVTNDREKLLHEIPVGNMFEDRL